MAFLDDKDWERLKNISTFGFWGTDKELEDAFTPRTVIAIIVGAIILIACLIIFS
jgi:hypothetical protein